MKASDETSGLFVTVEGPNGVGKSTLVAKLSQDLRRKGLRVHLSKEVTGGQIGKFIHRVHREYRGRTLAFLIAADRQHHIESEIIPALQTHDVVISDRYIESSLVYQRMDGVELSFLWKINAAFLKPHLSICISAPAHVIAKRMVPRKSFDRFEASFNPAEEVRLYTEATSFIERKGFNICRLNSASGSVADTARRLVRVIIRLQSQKAN